MKYLKIITREILVIFILIAILFLSGQVKAQEEKPIITKKMQKTLDKGKPLSQRQEKKLQKNITKKLKEFKATKNTNITAEKNISKCKKILTILKVGGTKITKKIVKGIPVVGPAISIGFLGKKQRQNLKNHIDKIHAEKSKSTSTGGNTP